MPRTFTKSQIDRLGERLSRSPQPEVGDLEALQRLRLDYDPALVQVEQILSTRLALSATSRLKTVGTIVDKLKRERTRLSTMQDVAGVRTVLVDPSGGLPAQDHLVKTICELFPDNQVIDRRTRPSHGYRAVHVVVRVDEFPVEIQVRTGPQDRWAQLMESAADRFGRQIRYGEPPNDPAASLGGSTVQVFIETLMVMSEAFAKAEAVHAKTSKAHEELTTLAAQNPRNAAGEQLRWPTDATAGLKDATSALMDRLIQDFEQLKEFVE